MKKVLAIILALVLVFALFACGTKKPETSAPGTAEPGASEPAGEKKSPYPNANPDGTINLDKIAHYDKNYDYTQNEKIKCTYIARTAVRCISSLLTRMSTGPLFNMEGPLYQHQRRCRPVYDRLQNQLTGVRSFHP